jgi:hypothetical protein
MGQEHDMTTSPTRPRKPLLSRLNLRHKWRAEHAPGGGEYPAFYSDA